MDSFEKGMAFFLGWTIAGFVVLGLAVGLLTGNWNVLIAAGAMGGAITFAMVGLILSWRWFGEDD